MDDEGGAVAAVAARHGFSAGAVAVLWDAMRRGGGRMAQFSHPELGGMGQWSGGMLQIGAMFDGALKARVAAACADLAEHAASARGPADPAAGGWQGQSQSRPQSQWQGQGGAPADPARVDVRGTSRSDWWPDGLGHPSASGSQGGTRYAYFAEARRLAIARAGRVTLYDTEHHRIFGVSQSMSRDEHLAFTADDGTVDLDRLAVVTR